MLLLPENEVNTAELFCLSVIIEIQQENIKVSSN